MGVNSLILHHAFSEPVERAISTEDNEAYSVTRRYLKAVNTQSNPAYVMTNIKFTSDRCRSPQA